MALKKRTIASLLVLYSMTHAAVADEHAKSGGEELFHRNCAQCHEGGNPQAPPRAAFSFMTPARIYKALTEGVMRPMAQPLSDQDKRRLAEFLSGRRIESLTTRPPLQCKRSPRWFDYAQHPAASGWGIVNTRNT